MFDPGEIISLLARGAKAPVALRMRNAKLARALRMALYYKRTNERVIIKVAGRTVRIEPKRLERLGTMQ